MTATEGRYQKLRSHLRYLRLEAAAEAGRGTGTTESPRARRVGGLSAQRGGAFRWAYI